MSGRNRELDALFDRFFAQLPGPETAEEEKKDPSDAQSDQQSDIIRCRCCTSRVRTEHGASC